jgi:hypothetical protein
LFAKTTEADNQVLIQAGIRAYTRFGFTTAQEGRTDGNACKTYRAMAEKNLLPIDVVAYPDIQSSAEWMKTEGNTMTTYLNRFRVGGVKLSLDGSPQGKTAWLTEPYKVPPPGQPKNYKGYPAIKEDAVVNELVGTAFANNWQVLSHCNGDASGDQFLRAIRKAADQYGNNDRRTVMIHAQIVREDQLDTMKVLGVIPSFFSMHTFYWGDWHADETLGYPRVDRISPTGDALKRGMLFTEHHDAPVANPDAIRILDNTVNRTSRSGKVIGPNQCVTAYQALQSITSWAAYQYFEEDRKGSIKAGKLADFVILDKNPVKIDPKQLGNLVVMETIKEGKQVYVKE